VLKRIVIVASFVVANSEDFNSARNKSLKKSLSVGRKVMRESELAALCRNYGTIPTIPVIGVTVLCLKG
jgi:hypothetical protein